MNKNELLGLLENARNQYEYDALIDKFYLVTGGREERNTKCKNEYSYLSARQMVYRRKTEISCNPDLL